MSGDVSLTSSQSRAPFASDTMSCRRQRGGPMLSGLVGREVACGQ